MKKITKEQKYMASLFVIVVTSIILFFYPELVKYPYSYTSIEEKKNAVEQNNGTLTSNELAIKGLVNQKEGKTTEENNVNNEALKLKRNINVDDFKLDIPSLLISLEQKSYDKNLKLTIQYDLIKTVGATQTFGNPEGNPSEPTNPSEQLEGTTPGATPETTPAEGASDPTKTDEANKEIASEGDKTIAGKPVENEETNKKNAKVEFSAEEIEKGVLTIDGLNTTIVPIIVEGKYNDVRSYIKYLDEIGLIEPSSVELSSKEKKVTAKIVLNIFNGEVL